MNGAQCIIEKLTKHSVDTIFGYPGGCIMPLYDALLDADVKHVLCRHEQAAALAADGYARSSGRLGVCLATSGPGATNLITGVANAYMDSIPMLVITGQVPRALIGTDAFQESDILGMTLGVVKHSYLVEDANDLPRIMDEAIALAMSGRPGPVWLDIPKDVLLEELDSTPAPASLPTESSAGELTDWDNPLGQARKMIKAAKRPLIYSGGGVMLAKAVTSYRHFADATGIPQVVTLKGIGNPGKRNPLNLGMLGMHGSRAANEAVEQCDLLIVIGARFDDRATGKPGAFAPNARIIHIDCDHSEIGKIKRADCVLLGDMREILRGLRQPLEIAEWREQCMASKSSNGFAAASNEDDPAPIQGPDFIATMDKVTPPEAIISCDVGQHQMWVAQYFDFNHPRQHLSSGGLGTMGYGLPAAMGAQFAKPGAPVINVSGDGSFMMNMQELATIQRYGLPIKLIILDNQRLGMVRQQQELFYAGRYSEVDLSDNPDFSAIAKAFGIPAMTISKRCQMRRSIETLLAYPGPMLLHVHIEEETNVWPIVKPGEANANMLENAPAPTIANQQKGRAA
ncbi:acetolactate synthase 2 catalytic subunit [Hahella sp. KA22]|uniref:acetolactate synthase 2 catalytic subunit n=1 Tax=Hahella sp. KA22 TaxID=1628392 RepID=UPI000FDE20A7|nr:acetolactate synthase 2 catalytic subunit [Hahella sp. KA22]AZZ95176.1 acetolactate synthase 2 catalytic subunit [Hahella sp. KA22]QAY52821.1 acetolactate synthase 2 catalytic subunit [Hahella sp. KA22]